MQGKPCKRPAAGPHPSLPTRTAHARQVLKDIVSRGADPANIRIVTVVAAPPALKTMADTYPGARAARVRRARGSAACRTAAPHSAPRRMHAAACTPARSCTYTPPPFPAGLRVYTAIIDAEVNEKGYIIPGLGDAGDRAFGTLG